jgi:uncharacterized protein (DUF2345 family)
MHRLRTTAGHTLTLNDNDLTITIEHPTGSSIQLASDGSISVSGRDITLKAMGDLALTSTGKVTVEAGRDIALTSAAGDISMNAANVGVNLVGGVMNVSG